ncbi:hypothetical protein BGW80DRAFT_1274332 [Lactifluus volemus]|nr:hypothetical protein BGW80DRAFT_1274332 [Lactifluus volemus]
MRSDRIVAIGGARFTKAIQVLAELGHHVSFPVSALFGIDIPLLQIASLNLAALHT